MFPDFRKLLGDAKQWMGRMELTFERLPETRTRGVDADGFPSRYPGKI